MVGQIGGLFLDMTKNGYSCPNIIVVLSLVSLASEFVNCHTDRFGYLLPDLV
jgi:hypothetical protein